MDSNTHDVKATMPSEYDDTELLAALGDGSIKIEDIDQETIDRLLSDGGTEVLASLLTDRHQQATDSIADLITEKSDNTTRSDTTDNSDIPVSLLFKNTKSRSLLWGATSLSRIAMAAAIVLTASVSIQLLRQKPTLDPMDWTHTLEGVSGIIDTPGVKGDGYVLKDFIQSDLATTHPLEPQVIDLDHDSYIDGIVFGFVVMDEASEPVPWSFVVFAGDDHLGIQDIEFRRWGLKELAAEGFTQSLASRIDGKHMSMAMGQDGRALDIKIDDNHDGHCDAHWTFVDGVQKELECDGSLLGDSLYWSDQQVRLDRLYRHIVEGGQIRPLPSY